MAPIIYQRQKKLPQWLAQITVEYLLTFTAFVFLLDFIWAKYNYWRYGRHEKRKHPGYALGNKKLAQMANLPLNNLLKLQEAHYVRKAKRRQLYVVN